MTYCALKIKPNGGKVVIDNFFLRKNYLMGSDLLEDCFEERG